MAGSQKAGRGTEHPQLSRERPSHPIWWCWFADGGYQSGALPQVSIRVLDLLGPP